MCQSLLRTIHFMSCIIIEEEQKLKPRKKLVPWLFSAPALLVYVFVVIVPIIWSVGFSLFEYNGIGSMKFVGVDNYVLMVRDPVFWEAVCNNLFFMIVSTAAQMIVGLALAIILSNIKWGANFLRVVYFIPCIISSMAISQIFQKLLSVLPEGVFAAVVKLFGMQPIALLSDSKWVLLAVTLIDSYKFVGIYMIIFFALSDG